MTDFFDGLERELTAAARRRAGSADGARRARPAGRGGRRLGARLRRPIAAALADLRAVADGAVVALAFGAVAVVAAIAIAADLHHRRLSHAPAAGGAIPTFAAHPCAGRSPAMHAVALSLADAAAPTSLRQLLRGDPRAGAGDRDRAAAAIRARAPGSVVFAGDVRTVRVRPGLTVWLVPARRCHPARPAGADTLFAVVRARGRSRAPASVVELGSPATIAGRDRPGGGGGRASTLTMTPAGVVSVRCRGHAPYAVVHRLVAFAGTRCHFQPASA